MSAALMELRSVTRSFPGDPAVHALRGVDLAVDEGDYVAIVGPSGSGKSTMLNILGLLDRPTTGEYLLEGSPTTDLDDVGRTAVRARVLGFVFQSFHLLPRRTALENVSLPLIYSGAPRAERESRARDALHRVGLGARVDFRPDILSGGERQRVAVARALVTRPRVVLADEPTGNLDGERTEEIMSLFEDLHGQGMTLVVITHDTGVAARAHRVVRITDGRLSEVS
ncbi:ABC transporter ATP-binding protein [Microbacterium sp. SLBN-111]|uniref:ABC transporter ATP-binding protein n=1 Tax=Microbacterium sp. SLBN-111 TaxID=3377733 RepID=UPI003C75B433